MPEKENIPSHGVDLRGYIYLPVWGKLYLVFLLGKDTRSKQVMIGLERRKNASLFFFLFSSIVITGSLVLSGIAAALALYAVKSLLGIDLLSTSPVYEVLKWLRVCH